MHEEVKAWLRRYGELWNDIDDLAARRDAIALRATVARTSELDGMPHGKGGRSDPTGTAAALITELDAEIKCMTAEARAVYHEIDDTVKLIRGRGSADKRCVLQCRYLDLCPWSEVAEILFGRRDDFDERLDTFMRRVLRIHAEALEALTVLVPGLAGTGNDEKEA